MPRTAVQVVTRADGGVYASPSAFSHAIAASMARAGLRAAGKRLHDLRGTRASALFAAGLADAHVETWMGWAPGQAAAMRRAYGDPETIAATLAGHLNAG
jgi:integrase